MKGTDLLEGFNFVDEAFIEEASDENELVVGKKLPIPFLAMEVAVACLVLFLLLTGGITVFLNSQKNGEPGGMIVEATDEPETFTPKYYEGETSTPDTSQNTTDTNTEIPNDNKHQNDNNVNHKMNNGQFSNEGGIEYPNSTEPIRTRGPVPTKRPLPNAAGDYVASGGNATSTPGRPSIDDVIPTRNPSPPTTGNLGAAGEEGNPTPNPTPRPTKGPGDFIGPTTGTTPSRPRPSEDADIEVNDTESPWKPPYTDLPQAPTKEPPIYKSEAKRS